jgi:hypothetical protein
LDESLPNHDLKTGYAHFDDLEEDEDLSDVSEGSYGSTRTRTARAGSNLGRNTDTARPSRRTTTRPPRAPNSTHATGYGGGGVFKQAAVEILRSEGRLMSTGDIARLALRRGLVRCTGKTPEATMASALYTDIKRKEGHSLFVRPREGLFGLREWVEEGVITITPPEQTTTLHHAHLPLPSSHHLHQHAAAMDSENGTINNHSNQQYYDTEQQQPGASQDSQGDRLMELLCAAEEINRDEISPLSSKEAEEDIAEEHEEKMEAGVKLEEQQTAAAAAATEEALVAANQAAAAVLGERNASTTFLTAPKTVISPALALENAQLEAQRLDLTYGSSHPEVGIAYLNLAKLYLNESTQNSMNSETWKQDACRALQQAQTALVAYQQALSSGGALAGNKAVQTLPPGTAPKAKQQGFLVPAAPGPLKLGNNTTGNPERTPAGPLHGGPVAAPTPLALEEARGWNAGPFSAVPPSSLQAIAGTSALVGPSAAAGIAAVPAAGVASDTENDADVEICLPVPNSKVQITKRLPLHAVAAPPPLTAT